MNKYCKTYKYVIKYCLIFKNEKGANALKIAMFGQKNIPGGLGGVETVAEELSVRFVEKGHDVTCLNRNVKGAEPVHNYKGVKIKRVWTINLRGIAAMSSSFFAAIIAAFGRYDIVHIHAEGPAFMCWLPKLFGKKVIVTIHGLDHQRAKWGHFAGWYIMCGEKNAVRFADEIIVLNKKTQQYFEERYGRKTVYIPNGITVNPVSGAELINKKFNLDSDDYILFLGRLVPEKGLEYLIKAFKTTDTDKKLIIAGDTSDTDAFVSEMRCEAEGDDRIHFIGWADGQLKSELFSNAYFYVLPSDLEGMPISLLEAMGYGCCCLVSDIPECTEVISENGVVFKHGNIDDLKEKLELLCKNKSLVDNYRNLTKSVKKEEYNWNSVTDKTIELYRSCLNSPSKKK